MSIKNLLTGAEGIKAQLEFIPAKPGIYKISDKDGNVIYVGKAKNLVKRVANYTHPERLEYRLQNMVAGAVSIEVITTTTEAEALLLEANLIKKFEPKYNILLKDDKSYPYILITEDHDFPRITKHRGKRKIKGSYYGPFASAGAVNKSMSDLQKAFLLRPCSDSFFSNRKRPCMEYQIKRCSAPCVDKISAAEYGRLIDQAKDFLTGKSRAIQQHLVTLMEEESLKMNYEKAAVYRDRIKALNHIQAKQSINNSSLKDADIIGIHNEGGRVCVQLFFFRGGQNFGGRAFFPKNVYEQPTGEILGAFLSQFYQENNPPPKDILVCEGVQDRELLEESLSLLANFRVKITHPKMGDKKDIVNDAVRNANNALQQRLLSSARQEDLLKSLADIFGLALPPKRIEVYDNSHISGTSEVGAMVVAGEDGFNKRAYRRFNIQNIPSPASGGGLGRGQKPGDDYAMMREVLTRRFKRLKQECPDKKPGVWPNLVLIDGGAGHLSVVIEVFEELGIIDEMVFACISKGPDRNAGREQFHMKDRDSFTLPYTDPAMYYLQILRDEAHRFAIGSHRIKRAKTMTKSILDEVPGVGGKRKKILLNHFGSADAVRNASIKELEKAVGINKATAEVIFNYFH